MQALDREAVLAKLPEIDRKIYHLCIEKDYTQTKVAELLNINQSTVARRLAVVCDLIESERLNNGTRTKDEIRFELLWLDIVLDNRLKHKFN